MLDFVERNCLIGRRQLVEKVAKVVTGRETSDRTLGRYDFEICCGRNLVLHAHVAA